MAGLVYEINSDEFQNIVGEIASRIEHRNRAMELIGSIGRESVKYNFEAGGRPEKWAKLKCRDGEPLRNTGRLIDSIGKQVDGNTVYVGVGVGVATNVEYAAVHHYGAAKGSFGAFAIKVGTHQRIVRKAFGKDLKFPVWATVPEHSRNVKLPWGNIPARPFMLLQEDDVTEIEGILVDWIMEGKA